MTRTQKAYILAATVASGGFFFIRDDWPFGFDGAYLAVAGVLAMVTLSSFVVTTRKALPKPGPCGWSFVSWVVVTLSAVIISGLLRAELGATLFLVREFMFVLLIFLVGYACVKQLRVPPMGLLCISAIWVLVATAAMVSDLFGQDGVRRVKALASVNYAASSFAVFFVLAVGYFLRGRSGSIWIQGFMFVTLTLSATGVLLSGSRSAYAGLASAAGFWALLATVSSIRGKVTASALRGAGYGAALLLVSIACFALLVRGLDITALLDRFTPAAMSESADRRMALIARSAPAGWSDILFGDGSRYALYSIGGVHPHNFFVSSLAFGGIGSLFTGSLFFLIVIVFGTKVAARDGDSSKNGETAVVLMLVIVAVMYAMVSGHFTRHWHMFWLLGLAASHLDEEYARVRATGTRTARKAAPVVAYPAVRRPCSTIPVSQ